MPRKKGEKRKIIEKDVERFDLRDVYNHYKKKLGQRHKNPKLKDLAWIVFADYLLLKKSDDGLCTCVTSGDKKYWNDPQMHPGHYRPQGQSKFLKFVEDNVRPQTYAENVGKNGNYREYYKFMVKQVGKKREEYLRTTKETKNRKNYEYAEMISNRWGSFQFMLKQLNNKRLPGLTE